MRHIALLVLAVTATSVHGRPTKSNRDSLQESTSYAKADKVSLEEKKLDIKLLQFILQQNKPLPWGVGEAFLKLPSDRTNVRDRNTDRSPRERRTDKTHQQPQSLRNKGPFSKSGALVMIIIFMLVVIGGMQPADIGTKIQFDGNDQNFHSFELQLRIYLSANSCTAAYDLPNPNPIGATEEEKRAAEKKWGLHTKAIKGGNGKRDEARTKANHARRAQDYKAGAILAAALTGGDAEALTNNKDDDLRFSAMWPRVLDAYKASDEILAKKYRAQILGSTDRKMFPNGNPKIEPDESLANRPQLRRWQNEITLAVNSLSQITKKTGFETKAIDTALVMENLREQLRKLKRFQNTPTAEKAEKTTTITEFFSTLRDGDIDDEAVYDGKRSTGYNASASTEEGTNPIGRNGVRARCGTVVNGVRCNSTNHLFAQCPNKDKADFSRKKGKGRGGKGGQGSRGGRGRGKGRTQRKEDPTMTICRNFNSQKGCNFPNCKRQHIRVSAHNKGGYEDDRKRAYRAEDEDAERDRKRARTEDYDEHTGMLAKILQAIQGTSNGFSAQRKKSSGFSTQRQQTQHEDTEENSESDSDDSDSHGSRQRFASEKSTTEAPKRRVNDRLGVHPGWSSNKIAAMLSKAPATLTMATALMATPGNAYLLGGGGTHLDLGTAASSAGSDPTIDPFLQLVPTALVASAKRGRATREHVSTCLITEAAWAQDADKTKIYPMSDSGCDTVILRGRAHFDTYAKLRRGQHTIATGGGTQHAVGEGYIYILVETNAGPQTIKLRALHVPSFPLDIIGESVLRKKGFWSIGPPLPKAAFFQSPSGSNIRLQPNATGALSHLPCTPITKAQASQFPRADRLPTTSSTYTAEHKVAAEAHYKTIATSQNIQGMMDSIGVNGAPPLQLTTAQDEAVRRRLSELRVYCPNDPTVDAFLLLHHKLGHPSLQRTAEHALDRGMKTPPLAKIFCRACAQAKMKRQARVRIRKAKAAEDEARKKGAWRKVCTDVAGPFATPSAMDYYTYLIAYVDEDTGFGKVYGMNSTRQVPERTKEFLQWVSNGRLDTPVQELITTGLVRGPTDITLQSDSAKYYRSERYYKRVQREQNIPVNVRQSSPYQQSKNGLVERYLQEVVSKGNCMRYAASLPPSYWYWATRHASMIHRYMPSARNDGLSPYEAMHGEKGDDTHLRAFGAPVEVKVFDAKKVKKPLPKSERGVYVGYAPENDSNMIHFPATDRRRERMRESNHVTIDDKRIPPDALTAGPIPTYQVTLDEVAELEPTVVTETEPREYHRQAAQQREREADEPGPTAPTSATPQDTTPAPTSWLLPKLKPGWLRATDPNTGRDYYYDQGRNTTWTPPLATEEDAPEAEPQHDPAETPVATANTEAQQEPAVTTDEPPESADRPPPQTPRQSKRRKLPEAPKHTASKHMTRSQTRRSNRRRGPRLALAAMLLTPLHEPTGDANTRVNTNACYAAIGEPIKGWTRVQKQEGEQEQRLLMEAYRKELTGLIDSGAATLVRISQIPSEYLSKHRIYRSEAIFTKKPDGKGGIAKRKARVVMDGSKMPDHPTYTSHMPRMADVRLNVADGTAKGRTIYSSDVPQAYLQNTDGVEELFMYFPQGLQQYASSGERLVIRVRNIYGRKNAGTVYEEAFSTWMIKQEGFKRLAEDKACYIRHKGTNQEVVLTAYVDDLIWHAGSPAAQRAFELSLHAKWGDCKTSATDYVLGINVHQSTAQGETRISLEDTITRMAQRYLPELQGGATDTAQAKIRQATTPLPYGEKVDILDCQPAEEPPIQHDYRGLVGSIQWAATTCRPDVAFACSQLARVQARPGPRHYAMAIHTLRYLYRTRNHGITYYTCSEQKLVAYADASWADTPGSILPSPDPDGRRSSCGHVVFYAGGAVSWESRTQPITTLSSTEAELVATVYATRDVLHLRRIVSAIGQPQEAVTIYGDNEPCIKLLADTHAQTNKRPRHIEVRWFFAREQQAAGNIRMAKVGTHDNVADIFTKNTGPQVHSKHTAKLVRPHSKRQLRLENKRHTWDVNTPHLTKPM